MAPESQNSRVRKGHILKDSDYESGSTEVSIKQQFWTLDNDHIGWNIVWYDVEKFLKSFIERHDARKMAEPVIFSTKWCATRCCNIILLLTYEIRWPRGTLYPQTLALTSPTSGGRSVGIVCSWTQAREFFFLTYEMPIALNLIETYKYGDVIWVEGRQESPLCSLILTVQCTSETSSVSCTILSLPIATSEVHYLLIG
jgi:hypothetical protein